MSRRDGVFKRNGWWWIDYHDADGRRHREKAAPSYEVAKLVYRDKMIAIAKGEVLGVREEGLRVKDFVDKRYWPAVEGTLAPEWAERSRDLLDRVLLPRFGAMTLSAMRREPIEAWYAERLGQVSATTANKELARLKHLIGRAETWGYCKTNPARLIKRAREAPGRVRYLSAEEYSQLLDGVDVTVTASDGRTWTVRRVPNPTLKLYIIAMLNTGARRSELVRLRWADVDMRARTVRLARTKNGHPRAVPMTDALHAMLAALPRPLSPEAPVLPERDPKVISRAFARLVADLQIPNLTFHDLRHHVGSVLTMAGVPQRTIMEILGHRDPRMTVRYQHLSPGHLRDAIRALEPPAGPLSTGTISAPAPKSKNAGAR